MNAHVQQFQLLAKYNRLFNQQLYQVVGELSDEDYRQDVGAFFKSVHGTLSHILLADRIWLGRFSRTDESKALRDASLVFEVPSLAHQLYNTYQELRTARDATDEVIEAWTAEFTPSTLELTMRYHTFAGKDREHPLWFAATHFFNHQTHHRGQVTTLLNQLGKQLGVTDFLAWVNPS